MNAPETKRVEIKADFGVDEGAAIYALEQAIEDNEDEFSLTLVDKGFAFSRGSEEGYRSVLGVEAGGDLVVVIDVSGSDNTPEHEGAVLGADFAGYSVTRHTCRGDCDVCHKGHCVDEELSGVVVIESIEIDGKRLVVTVAASPE